MKEACTAEIHLALPLSPAAYRFVITLDKSIGGVEELLRTQFINKFHDVKEEIYAEEEMLAIMGLL